MQMNVPIIQNSVVIRNKTVDSLRRRFQTQFLCVLRTTCTSCSSHFTTSEKNMSSKSDLSGDSDKVQATTSTYAKQPADNAVDRKKDQRMAQFSKLLNGANQSVWRYKSWTYTCGHQTRHQSTIAWPPKGFNKEEAQITKTENSATIHYKIMKEFSDVRRIFAIEAGRF